MAEAFGIISGAVGIATAFGACVECFDYIQSGRHFAGGRDFQTEDLKLALLQLRLSRWGEAVNVYEDPRLGSPKASEPELQTAKNTLFQILVLFEDSQKISQRYRSSQKPAETEPSASPLLPTLRNRLRSIASKRRKQATIAQLASWAIYRKDQYSALIENISTLIANLESLFPAPDTLTRLADQEVQQVTLASGDESADFKMLSLLQGLCGEVDRVLSSAIKKLASQQGVIYNKIIIEENAKVKNGDFVSLAWKGTDKLPAGEGRTTFEQIGIKGHAKVRNGTTYGDRDDFFDD